MVHIAVFIGSIRATENPNELEVSGEVRVSQVGDPIQFTALTAFSASSLTQNAAIQAAAVAAVQAAGFSVVPLDNKTVYAGAVGF